MSSQAEREYDALYDDFEQVRAERDTLAQRCRELEEDRQRTAGELVAFVHGEHSTVCAERDTLRAEVEQLRQQAARYERLRRLDPRQFAELHQRNLAGERFDDMVAGGAE